MLTEQAQIVGFNPQIMYLAIGTPFPGFKGKFGNKVNGILLYGGLDTGAPGLDAYYKAHREFLKRESEAGAVGVYAALELTQQAIETVGELDRKKIRDVIASTTFKTIWGEIQYKNQLHANPWAVGQWQNGEVVGLYPANKSGAKKLQFPKPAWT
jgi:branched-chain amino acid transport system substrate-binding protein